MGFTITCSLLSVLVLFAFAVNRADALTILYSGEEHGQLGLHGCGTEQVGGLAHRHTLISDLSTRHDAVLRLHIGNLIDATDKNAEWIYQIGLTALDAMEVDVLYQIHLIHRLYIPLRWSGRVEKTLEKQDEFR